MRKRAAIFVLGLMLTAMTGCWDASSPEHIAWVAALGVDEGPGNNFIFTFQTIVPRAVASTSGGTSGGSAGGREGHSFVVYSLEAPDVISALVMSDAFVARRVNLLHAKALVLGEGVVKQGLGRLLAPAIRYREFRRTLQVLVSKGTARDFLRLSRPKLENDPALWYEVMLAWQQETNLVATTRIHDFVLAMEQPGLGARAALVAPRPDIARGEERLPESEAGRYGSPTDVTAGQASRLGELPVEFLGTAVFKGDRLVGYLTGQETRAIAAMRGELTRRTGLAVPDPRNPSNQVVVLLQNQSEPVLQVQRTGNRVHVEFRVRMEGDLGSIPSRTDYTKPESLAELEESTEKYLEGVQTNLLRTSLHEWGIDLFKLGDRLRPTFPTTQEWRAFDWGRHINKATFRVDVVFQIRRHGLQEEPVLPEG